MASNTSSEPHSVPRLPRPGYFRSVSVLPTTKCHPAQIARSQIGDKRGAVYLPVCDSPPSSTGASTAVSLFDVSRATTPASISSVSSAPPVTKESGLFQTHDQNSTQQGLKRRYDGEWLAEKAVTYASKKLTNLVSVDNVSNTNCANDSPLTPAAHLSVVSRSNSCRSRAASPSPQTGNTAESRRLPSFTDGAQDNLYSEDWPASQFLDPFAQTPISEDELSLNASDAEAYLRRDAFAGHRDTLARLHFNEDKSMLIPVPVVDSIVDFLTFNDYKNLRLASRQWHDALPCPTITITPDTSVASKLPAEVLHSIYEYLQPCDFDAARHSCKSWFMASLDRRIARQMMTYQGTYPALLADIEHRRQLLHSRHLRRIQQTTNDASSSTNDEFEENSTEEWLISKRLATESRLSAAWHGSGLSKTSDHSSSRFALTQVVDFTKLAFQDAEINPQAKRFTMSACGRFVLVVVHTDIFVYSVDAEGSQLKPRVRLVGDKEVLSVSMDSSSGRYAVAALLEGRIGVSWDIQDIFTVPGISKMSETLGLLPSRTTPTNIYKSVGSPDDLPRSVAICPNRDCVAYGCRTGIELRWTNALTGKKLNRWFPLAAPSDFLYFLPHRPGVDSDKKLKLISSAADPVRRSGIDHHNSTLGQSSLGSKSRPRRRQLSIASSYFDDLSFHSDASAEDNVEAADCDHYKAVPLSDGVHSLFTDPATGLLCLGSDAPLGGPTKLVRKICMAPPVSDCVDRTLVSYAAGQDLSWGVRIVAAYNDGSIFLFNIPKNQFERICNIRSTNDVWDELAEVVGHSGSFVNETTANQTNNPTGLLSTADQPTPGSSVTFRSLHITGAFVCRVDSDVEALRVDCNGGGLRLWIFQRSGLARKVDIYAPRKHQVQTRIVGTDGLIRNLQTFQQEQDSGKENVTESQGSKYRVHFAGLDGTSESAAVCDLPKLEAGLQLLEKLNKDSLAAHPDPVTTPEPQTEDSRPEKLQLEVFTDWRHEFLLSPYKVNLE